MLCIFQTGFNGSFQEYSQYIYIYIYIPKNAAKRHAYTPNELIIYLKRVFHVRNSF